MHAMSSILFSHLTVDQPTAAPPTTSAASGPAVSSVTNGMLPSMTAYLDVWTPLDGAKEFDFDAQRAALTPTPPGFPPSAPPPPSALPPPSVRAGAGMSASHPLMASDFYSAASSSGSSQTAGPGGGSSAWMMSAGGPPPPIEASAFSTSNYDFGILTPPPPLGPLAVHPADNVGIVQLVINGNLTVEQIMSVLNGATTEELVLFFSSMKACRYMNDALTVHEQLKHEIAALLLRSEPEVTYKLSMNPVGNYMMQSIIGVDEAIDRHICTAFVARLYPLTMDKYGCRVVQTLLTRLPLELVHQLVDAMRGFVMEAAVNRHSVHVIHCIASHHNSWVLEKVMNEVCEPRKLAFLAEDKFGCRLIQHCLESLSEEMTPSYTPPLLSRMVQQLLGCLERFSTNKYANYIVQFFLTHPAFWRQRDEIIERIVMGNILALAQCQYGSHIVEAALQSAGPQHTRRMFDEIFHDYNADRYNRTPLEVILFNQYGNYVIQRLLHVAIDVVNGKRAGDKNWLVYIAHAVFRNKSAIDRYASGKKIIQLLRTLHPDLFPC
ncbi:PUM-HD domain-containing protein [Aphelenchoides fujianensis]|nr:PUM-HD domain-containing protein [Aphelenchoides fujianensis]